MKNLISIRFNPDRYQDELGNTGEICAFSEYKKANTPDSKNSEWTYFIPHNEITAEFYSNVDDNTSIWEFVDSIEKLGVEIYALDENRTLFGISNKHGIRLITENAYLVD